MERSASPKIRAAAGILLALAWAFSAAAHGPADRAAAPAALALGVALAAGLSALAIVGLPQRAELQALRSPFVLLAAVAGATSAAAPFLVSFFRYSDAPAGSVVVFVTTSLWGGAAALAAWLSVRSRMGVSLAPTSLAGALLAVSAGAGILANWERPSSFSPIVRFGGEQAMMLLAGGMWVAGLTAVALFARSRAPRAVIAAYAGGAVVSALALLPFSRPAEADVQVILPYVVAAGMATALAVWLSSHGGMRIVAAALLAAPALLSALTIVEQAVGMLGPRPLLVGAVLGASALVAFGIAALVMPAVGKPVSDAGSTAKAGRGVAALAVALAAVALVAPALRVTVHGILASGKSFDATFSMHGFEALGAWLALSAAALALSAWWSARPSSRAAGALAALAAAVASLTPLASTPMHTWVTWIPPEVQQDYGTEYASIVFRSVAVPWVWASVAASVVSVLLLARLLLSSRRTEAPSGGAVMEARR